LLPDELEHQELVKIGVQQRPRNRVQFPIVVMSAPGEVDDHDVTILLTGNVLQKQARSHRSVGESMRRRRY
jgi:hypothetical protein